MPASEQNRAARIGIVLHDFPAGGTERIAIRLAERWAAIGRSVTIFCGTQAGPARSIVSAEVQIREASPSIARGAGSRRRFGHALRAMVADHPVDVLIGAGNFHVPVLAAAGRLPCAIVCKLSNPIDRPDRGRISQHFHLLATRWAVRSVDRLIAMSPALNAEAEALRKLVETLWEPILDDEPAPRARGRGKRVLCAGRMVAQKRFDRALLGFAALADGDATLVMLGDGPERERLEAHARALGITSQVRFVGYVADIAPWLARADAILLTSDYEGYPAVLIEAIAAGVPVVTTRCSRAIDEILFDPTFGVVSPHDPREIAASLCMAMARPIDETARSKLVARHHAATAADRWLAMLDRVVAAKAG